VGDQDHRRPGLDQQRLQQVQDLRLDRDVQRGGRLVGDDQRGPAGDGHGDHHPLAHAAGELVGVVVQALAGVGDGDLGEQVARGGARLAPVHALVEAQGLGDLLPDRQDRVQRGHRLLEDHGDPVAPERADAGVAQAREFDAFEAGPARLDPAGVAQQPQQRERRHALARAALADDGQGLARIDVEGDAVDGAQPAARRPELDRQILHVQQVAHSKPIRRFSSWSIQRRA
jgi:hypothetical protein